MKNISKKVNSELSTITITYNNEIGLQKTLESLLRADCKPFEIIIIDGGSEDNTIEIINKYKELLPQINFSSKSDEGIYDALNIGKRKVKTKLVHYLNAGDEIFGNPYDNLANPCLLRVEFVDSEGLFCGTEKVKLFGTSYNHQGVIVKSSHHEFDLNFDLAADYKMLLQEFPESLNSLRISDNGGVRYLLGGISSQ